MVAFSPTGTLSGKTVDQAVFRRGVPGNNNILSRNNINKFYHFITFITALTERLRDRHWGHPSRQSEEGRLRLLKVVGKELVRQQEGKPEENTGATSLLMDWLDR